MNDNRSAGISPTWLLAATVVALANAGQVATRISPELRRSTRLLVHIYDLGLFWLLGLACMGVAYLLEGVSHRSPSSGKFYRLALVLILLGAVFGALTLGQDLDGFVIRHRLRVHPAALGALIGLVSIPLLAALKHWIRGWILRGGALLVGLSAAFWNASFLEADYRGLHFMVTLGASVALAAAFGDRIGSRWPDWVRRGVVFGVASTVGLIAFVSPRDSVRQGLWASSGSSIFPLISNWVARPSHFASKPLPVENSSWFQSRTDLPVVQPHQPSLLPQQPAVLLLTIEALRSDVIDNKDLAATLPTLARIRDHSLWFRQARTPSPATVVTVASLLTGKYYSQIHFTRSRWGAVEPLSDHSTRLPTLLEAKGIETTHVVAYRSLQAKYGIGRGFGREIRTRRNFGKGSEVMQFVIDELERFRKPSGHPLFLYAHFLDSHAPYTSAGERATPYEGYLAELQLVDAQLARLLKYLEETGLKERVLLVVGADHGEAFGEHGMNYHGRNVYEELLRIPLMFLAPFIRPGQLDQPVTLLDLTPTFLDLFGIATPGDFMGQSLVPLLQGKEVRLERPIAADAGRRKQALFFDDGIKVILDLPALTVEVYDLNRDPHELRNLVDDPTRDLNSYIGATERFFATHVLRIPGWKPPWRRS